MAVIDMDIKPNSDSYISKKETAKERTKAESVVRSDGVVSSSKPISKKIAKNFIQDDWQDLVGYILMDLVVPGIKNAILDTLSMAFFHETRRGYRDRDRDRYDRTPYRSYYRPERDRDRRRDDRYERERRRDVEVDTDRYDYRNIILRYREDAEAVVDKMRGRVREYGYATVAELFDYVGVTAPFTDNSYGWDRVDDICLRRVSRGYLIDVPEAKVVD